MEDNIVIEKRDPHIEKVIGMEMCKKSSCRSWELVSVLGACVGLGSS